MRVGLALSSSSNDLRNFLWIGIFASPTESRPKSSSFWSLNSSCVSTSNSGKSSLIATQPTGRPSKRTPFVNDSSYTEIIYIYIIDCPLDFWREEPSVELIGILEIHLDFSLSIRLTSPAFPLSLRSSVDRLSIARIRFFIISFAWWICAFKPIPFPARQAQDWAWDASVFPIRVLPHDGGLKKPLSLSFNGWKRISQRQWTSPTFPSELDSDELESDPK